MDVFVLPASDAPPPPAALSPLTVTVPPENPCPEVPVPGEPDIEAPPPEPPFPPLDTVAPLVAPYAPKPPPTEVITSKAELEP